MRCRKLYKRFLAGLCILAMLVSSLGPDIQAAAGSKGENRKQMERDMEELIKKTLKNEDPDIRKDYPKGIFSFATLKGEVNEENKDPLAVYLVRHGGTKGEQKVKIKFSDYSAEYGKDYYAKLDDSIFAEKVEANPDSVPLFYMFDDDPDADGGQAAIDEESIIRAYGEERGKKIIAMTREYAEAESDAKPSGDKTSGTKQAKGKKADDNKTSASGQKKASSPLDQLIDGTSQYTDSGYALTMDELLADDKRNGDTATYGANMLDTIFPGAETELVFAEGEYMKKIYVYPIDNKTANGDRVFNIQINSGDKDLAWQEGENSSTVTILDDEKDETAQISIQSCPESVGTDGKASVTLKRKGGLYKVSTVEFAVKAADKKVAKGTAIFMPDMKERTVEFSVGDVNAKTVDNISFVLKKPVGARIAGDRTASISLADLKITSRATTSGKDVSEKESPVGMNGKLAFDGIDLDLNNFQQDDRGGPCGSTSFTTSKSEMKLLVPDHWCGCNNSWVAAALKKKINQEAVESVSMDLYREDMEGAPCNNMFVSKLKKSSGANYKNWNKSVDNLLALGGDHLDKSTMTVNFTNGTVTGWKTWLLDYKEDFMKYNEKYDNPYMDFSIAAKKTSGGINGMDLRIYKLRLNFRNFKISIQPADELVGHKGDRPGQLLFARTETPGENKEEVAESTRYAYEKVNFKNYPDDYAYLDCLKFTDGTVIDPKYYEIGGTSVTLDMNDSFFKQYKTQIDAKNAKFDIKPVYAKKSVKLTINADKHGGIEVEGVKYPRGTKDREITVHVGDKLKVKPYDVEPDYNFSCYEMIATGLNGKGDSKKNTYTAEEPDNIDIQNYNYTIKPKYTAKGTSVVVEAENIPDGCGIEKTEWTHKNDKIHSGQIMDIKATTADGYRAKWTIISNTHEWYNKTFYGDTFYHKIGGPTDVIRLEFEKCTNMQYVSVSGKALVQDATIKNKPFLNSKGEYLGNYVPVANATVQMGEFSGLTKQDGNYTIYSHTESEETASEVTGTNVTTYLKAGPNETRTVKVIHNGLEQVKYIEITGNLNGVHSSPSDPCEVTDIPALDLDFFGEGPVPVDIDTLLGTPDEEDFPTRLETSEKIEMRNYSVGFELTLADVRDENGEDLIDKVNFYIYNKDNVYKTTHTVEREKPGQTVYTLDRYLIQDDEGKVGYMKLNGLTDFVDGDKIYVELVGTMKDQDGNKVEDADMSYGLYDSGIRFQEKLDVIEVQLKDVEPGTEEGGVPTVDVLGQMLPTVKIGKLGVSAVITSNTMEFSVGFDLAKLNKGIYDSLEAKDAKKANDLQTDIDNETATKADKQKSLDDKQAEYKTKEEEYQEIWSNPDPSDADKKRAEQLDQEMTALEKDMDTLGREIDTCNKTINEKQAEYDKLTAPPEEQKDPLDPALPEGEDELNVTEPVTPEEITNPLEVTGVELNPLDKEKGGKPNPLTKIKEELKNAAKKTGMTNPKGEGMQGHGSVSANLGVDIGVTVRLKTQVMNNGNAEWCFDKALVYVKVSGGISAMYYFVIPNFPIPMYAGASFSASVGMYQGMGSQQKVTLNEMGEEEFDGSELYYTGDVPVTLGIEGFVGMGLKSLLAIELGIGFLQKFDFAYNSNGGQVGTGMTSLYGFVQTNVLFFSYKWKFAQANWNYELYNTSKNAKANLQKLMQENGLGSDAALSEFTVEDTPKVHYYGEAKTKQSFKRLRSSYAKNDSTVLASGLTRTVSDIVPLGGGKYLLAFEGVRAEADCPADMKPGSADYDCNSRAIYLSYFDGNKWSAPAILQKDDTLDTGLQIEEIGDDILISWSSADRRFKGDEIYTGKLSEDGEKEVREDAAAKVLSSLDVYAAVMEKSGVESFVEASAEDKEAKINRLTKDQDLTEKQRKTVEANLAEGAEYLGYGHENGQAVSVGDQIYLFYDTIDYNYWKNGEKTKNLSDIVDAKGYILYKIYDKKTGKWMEDYADSKDKEVYEKLGFTLGQRMADIHLSVSGSDKKILPMVSQMDAQAVKVKGEDRIALTYMVDSNGTSGTREDGTPEGDQALFIAFMTPAEIAAGTVKAEAEWSEPLEMTEELSSINAPQMVQTKNNGKETIYLMWADDDCLMYTNLTRLFQKAKKEDGSPYTPVETTTAELENGKKVEVYKLMEGVEQSIAILGDEENGFQYNNGYRLAADDKGHIYAVWAQSSGSAQGLYLSAMSVTGEDGTEIWSKPRALDWDTEYGGRYLTDPSIAVDSDGTIILGHNAYNLKNITKEENGNRYLDHREHADDTFCVTVEKAVGSPVLEDAELSNDYPRAGEEFTVSASAGNDGFLAAEQINVKAEFVQKKGGEEKVLDTQTQTFTNVGSGHRDAVNLAFTMKQEYLDAAKDDQATYQIRLTASEKKAGGEADYAETASAAVDVRTGAHYVFTNENVDGYRCRDIRRDAEAGTVEFGKETGENRYLYSATVMNDGNLPAEDMKVAMFASNENAFTSTRDKNGTYEGTEKELTEYYKTHSATESVVNNEKFNNWIAMRSFLAEDVGSLGVGESADLDVMTTKIADDMYSNLGAMDLMLAVYDKAAADNAATKSEGMSTQPVSIVEEESVKLTLCSGGRKAGDQTVANGSTTSFNALVLPLKAAPDYTVLWESSNPEVATVNNGDVTAAGAGTTTIKASLMKDGKEVMNRSVDVTVKDGDNPPASQTPKPSASQTPEPSASQTPEPSASQPPAASQKPQDNAGKQVKLSFDGNKGKVQGSAAKTVTVGEKYGKLPKAERKGYSFKGWYTAKSDGTKVTKDTKVTNASAHSLYAHWKKVTVGKVQIRKLTAQKGKLKISLKPVKSADGYQICYAPKKKFKKNKKKLNTKKKTATIKKLKRGKTWYVKARAYKLDSAGKKVFGKYSKTKKKKL